MRISGGSTRSSMAFKEIRSKSAQNKNRQDCDAKCRRANRVSLGSESGSRFADCQHALTLDAETQKQAAMSFSAANTQSVTAPSLFITSSVLWGCTK